VVSLYSGGIEPITEDRPLQSEQTRTRQTKDPGMAHRCAGVLFCPHLRIHELGLSSGQAANGATREAWTGRGS
jgi:hypothetical protein